MFRKIKKISIIATPSIRTYIFTALLVLIAFLGVTFWSWNNAKNNISKELNTSLNTGINSATDLINTSVLTYGEVLRGTSGLFYIDPNLSEGSWNRYVNNLNLSKRYPGLQGISFNQHVRASELDDFLANTKRPDGSSYTLKPAASGKDYYVINKYILSDDPSFKGYYGFDIASESSRKETVEQARDTGQLAVSGNIPRLIDNEPGMTLIVPIYKRDQPTGTIAERQAAILGYVSSGIRVKQLIEGLFGKAITKDSAIQLYDGSDSRKDKLVYQSQTYDNLIKQKNLFNVSKTFDIGGHRWTLTAIANRQFASQDPDRLPRTILYGGIVLSFLISTLLLFIMVSRARAISNEKNKEVQEVKDSLISLASHQLRTPATGVKQFISMVLEGYAGKINKEQKSMLEKAYLSNERQLDIINQILHVTRADSGRLMLNKERIDVNQIVKNVISELHSSTKERQQKVSFKSSANKVYLKADPQYLTMAIDNLLSNATKYSHKKKRINVDVKRTKDNIIITVTDKGVGIDPKDMHLLFQKFSRIHNELSVEAGGNGIGLYLCKEIIELHGGTIEVNSEPQKGSAFIVTLPKM